MSAKNPKVDALLNKPGPWRKEMQKLRAIVRTAELTEEFKWGWPCYALDRKNVVLIHSFKHYCALLFFKGALIQDDAGILIRQTENMQSSRQVRFASLAEIVAREATLKGFVQAAIAVEKAGLKVKLKKVSEFKMVPEFKAVLDQRADLKKAFGALTPGRQRAYLLYFSTAKQAKTVLARIEKSIQPILAGKGLNE
ncbi:MAG: YdeI/OmpD-associated family protein [Planctomycetota bacterium]